MKNTEFNGVPLQIRNGKSLKYLIPGDWIDTDFKCRGIQLRKGENIYIPNYSLPYVLKHLGLSSQKWYDKLVLGIDNPDDRLKCPVCGNKLEFGKLVDGYMKYCSLKCAYDHNNERAEKLRQAQINNWNNPEFREHHRDGQRKWLKSELGGQSRKIAAEHLRAYYESDKGILQRAKSSILTSERLKSMLSDPDSVFNSKEYRTKLSIMRSNQWKDPNSVFNSDKYRNLRSSIHKYIWSHPDEYKYFHEVQNRLKIVGGAYGLMWRSGSRNLGTKSFLHGIHESEKAGKVRYMSSYELKFIHDLDQDEEVITYKSQPMAIPYIGLDGKPHKYFPDFLVITKSTTYLIEVKPEAFLDIPENQLKFEIGRQYAEANGWEWSVLTETELGL